MSLKIFPNHKTKILPVDFFPVLHFLVLLKNAVRYFVGLGKFSPRQTHRATEAGRRRVNFRLQRYWYNRYRYNRYWYNRYSYNTFVQYEYRGSIPHFFYSEYTPG